MNFLNLDFLTRLDAFLQTWGGRCSCERWGSSSAHQAKVNPGAPNSFHCYWRAVDLTFDDPSCLMEAASDAVAIGFLGVEASLKNFHLHLDNRTGPWLVVELPDGTYKPLAEYQKGGVGHV